MASMKFENTNKNLCVVCDRHTITGKMTCSSICHEKFVEFCEKEYGVSKMVTDITTGITYVVPTRDIVEKGLKWEDLPNYPRYEEVVI